MNLRYKTILDILKAQSNALTCNEIYNEMDAKEQSAFNTSVDVVSKALTQMRERHNYVTNGISEIDKGRTKLTWLITQEGLKALSIDALENRHTATFGPEYIEDLKDDLTKTLPETQNETFIQTPEPEPSAINQTDASKPITEDVNSVAKPEIIEITPEFAVDHAINLIKQAFESVSSEPKAPKIVNKSKKINVLIYLRNFIAPLSNDLAMTLQEIIDDLEKLEAA